MTEGSENPPRRKPGRSIKKELLVLVMLLVAIAAVFALIYWQGLAPDFLLPAAPTQTVTPPEETSLPETTPAGFTSLVETLTAGPLVETMTAAAPAETPLAGALLDEAPVDETPTGAETPAPALTSVPSQTPTYGSCQYTLKEGPADFLYAIYWNWHINQNIRNQYEFYAQIYCAALLNNMQCTYHADDPDTLLPGWILVLPGVSADICSLHGGTPVP